MNDSMWYRLISNITFIHLIDPFYCRSHSFRSWFNFAWMRQVMLALSIASDRFIPNDLSELNRKYEMWFYLLHGFQFTEFYCVSTEKKERNIYTFWQWMNEWTVYNVCNVYPNMPKVLMENHMHSPFLHRTTVFSLSWLSTARMWMCNIKKFFLSIF